MLGTLTLSRDTAWHAEQLTFTLPSNTTVDTITYTYTDTVWADRLTAFDGTSISYDQIGNPLNWRDGATLSWQHGRQLAGYSKGGTQISYVYNADGIRTSKTVNGITTTYNVIDGTLRRMTSGENTLEFINGTSVIFNGTEYWYVFNAQNDVIGLIDENGEYVVKYTYDAWGALLSKSGAMADTLGALNPFRYRGYIYDEETGLYYVSSRYYDPVVGRWLNSDSIVSGIGGDVRGYNTFAYCFNNPTNMVDYTGGWANFVHSALEQIEKIVEDGMSALMEIACKNSESIVYYDVPVYEQDGYSLCWAFCEVMVYDSLFDIKRTQTEAEAKAIETAKKSHGEMNWNRSNHASGFPIKHNSITTLFSELQNGPLYASYRRLAEDGTPTGHAIVVNGVNLNTNKVYTTNPWGNRAVQTYDEFLNGIYGSSYDWEFTFIYRPYRKKVWQ